MSNLSEKAMIAKLHINQWTARKYDRKVSEKVDRDYGSHNSGRFNKILIAEEAINKITRIVGEARRWHYENTLPWGESWEQLLPVANFQNHRDKMREFEGKFNEAANEFTDAYPDLIEEARSRLNGMFDEKDYPPAHLIREKFGFQISYYPVPSAGDLRVEGISEGEAHSIRQSITAEMEKLQNEASRNLWERIHENVAHMAERLSMKDALFRDSLVGNLRELCELLKVLNVQNDTELEEMRIRIEQRLAGYDPDVLRQSRRIRQETAHEARAILTEIETKRKIRID